MRCPIHQLSTNLPAPEVVHKHCWAEMDSEDTLHCAHICHILLDILTVLQQWQLLCVLLHGTGLLWSLCHLQFPFPVLWVPGRRRKYHVWNKGQAHTLQLSLWNILPVWQDLHHWLLEILQAGYAAVLPGEAPHGLCHYFPASLWPLQGWWLVSRWRILIHNLHLQY